MGVIRENYREVDRCQNCRHAKKPLSDDLNVRLMCSVTELEIVPVVSFYICDDHDRGE